MSDSLYEHDALAWAERQAALLRRLVSGERVSEEIDWPNVIEEVQDVGLSELRACESLMQQAMAHLLKLRALPESQATRHWRDEIRGFLNDAARRFTPSMRQRINLDTLYAKAMSRAQAAADDVGAVPRPLPEACPFALDALLAGDVTALAAKLAGP